MSERDDGPMSYADLSRRNALSKPTGGSINNGMPSGCFNAIIGLLFAAVFILCGMAFSRVSCDARWPGRETKWTVMGGCLVKAKDGLYVPDDRMRDVQ